MIYEIIKGRADDFKDAPESALVRISYRADKEDYVFAEEFARGAKFWYTNGDVGLLNGYYTHGDVIAERKIVEEKWDGKGLPPIRSKVEIIDINDQLRYGQNESGEVIAHVENTAVVRMSYGLGCFEAEFLRPIRSPEDVAREEVANVIADVLRSSAGYDTAARNIYDAIAAGKISGLKLEKLNGEKQ